MDLLYMYKLGYSKRNVVYSVLVSVPIIIARYSYWFVLDL